ncbi:MAG TPA: FAD:protein FMN transferase, partial [Thermoleophilaceae bacterium]|nr:FAD:protein FMN transferase [Thermoleophilaceae bacterium]
MRSAGQLVCVVELDGAVATSGAYERGEHVLDPESGLPARGVRSATVTGPDLDLADALSTGLFAAGEGGLEWIDSIPAYEAMVVRNTAPSSPPSDSSQTGAASPARQAGPGGVEGRFRP